MIIADSRVRLGRAFLGLVAGLVKHAGHRLGARGQGRASKQHRANLLAAPIGVILLEHQDRPLGDLGQAAPHRSATGLVLQPGRAFRLELLLPRVEGVLRDAPDEGREIPGGKAAPSPGVEQEEALLAGQG